VTDLSIDRVTGLFNWPDLDLTGLAGRVRDKVLERVGLFFALGTRGRCSKAYMISGSITMHPEAPRFRVVPSSLLPTCCPATQIVLLLFSRKHII
jgi:hypothetical protein